MAAGRKQSPKITVGTRFHNLVTVKRDAKRKGKISLWECVCDCGQTSYIATADLNRGHSKTCGHCKTEESYRGQYSKLPELKVWKNMRSRCENINSPSYPYYGGRGICVKLSFKEFLDEVGNKPGPEYSIDRIDVNGHYEKGNLRWALRSQQQRNTRKGQEPTANIYKRDNRWISRISIANKTVFLGTFKSKEEAVKAREKEIKRQNLILNNSYV